MRRCLGLAIVLSLVALPSFAQCGVERWSMLGAGVDALVGETRDFLSYHSQFHPTELAMRYVVVRGGLDISTTREAMLASISRAIVNPGGNGWF